MTPERREKFIEELIAIVNDPKSYRNLPDKMDITACVPAKYWPKLWLREMLTAALAEEREEILAIIAGGDRPWRELADIIRAREGECKEGEA